MTTPDATGAFQAMIAEYEERGWEIRSINQAELRATLRAGVMTAANAQQGGTATAVAGASICRKLWVDAKGEVQETSVPC